MFSSQCWCVCEMDSWRQSIAALCSWTAPRPTDRWSIFADVGSHCASFFWSVQEQQRSLLDHDARCVPLLHVLSRWAHWGYVGLAWCSCRASTGLRGIVEQTLLLWIYQLRSHSMGSDRYIICGCRRNAPCRGECPSPITSRRAKSLAILLLSTLLSQPAPIITFCFLPCVVWGDSVVRGDTI
jgi:hypothetical protein